MMNATALRLIKAYRMLLNEFTERDVVGCNCDSAVTGCSLVGGGECIMVMLLNGLQRTAFPVHRDPLQQTQWEQGLNSIFQSLRQTQLWQ